MTITTATIETLCLAEERHARRRDGRIAQLLDWVDAPSHGRVERDLSLPGTSYRHERVQLAMEAVKWHQIRAAGHSAHAAMDAMTGFAKL